VCWRSALCDVRVRVSGSTRAGAVAVAGKLGSGWDRGGTTDLGAVQAGSLYPVTSHFRLVSIMLWGVAVVLQSVLPQSSSARVLTRCSFAAWVALQVAMRNARCNNPGHTLRHCRPIAWPMRTSGFLPLAGTRTRTATLPFRFIRQEAGGRTAENEQHRKPRGKCSFAFGAEDQISQCSA
jgi:hypothetical protein